jgi:hypothetical protein
MLGSFREEDKLRSEFMAHIANRFLED